MSIDTSYLVRHVVDYASMMGQFLFNLVEAYRPNRHFACTKLITFTRLQDISNVSKNMNHFVSINIIADSGAPNDTNFTKRRH